MIHGPPLEPPVRSLPMATDKGPCPAQSSLYPNCAVSTWILLPLNGAPCGYPRATQFCSRLKLTAHPSQPVQFPICPACTVPLLAVLMMPMSSLPAPVTVYEVRVARKSEAQHPCAGLTPAS